MVKVNKPVRVVAFFYSSSPATITKRRTRDYVSEYVQRTYSDRCYRDGGTAAFCYYVTPQRTTNAIILKLYAIINASGNIIAISMSVHVQTIVDPVSKVSPGIADHIIAKYCPLNCIIVHLFTEWPAIITLSISVKSIPPYYCFTNIGIWLTNAIAPIATTIHMKNVILYDITWGYPSNIKTRCANFVTDYQIFKPIVASCT
jgi:hypothetical protein